MKACVHYSVLDQSLRVTQITYITDIAPHTHTHSTPRYLDTYHTYATHQTYFAYQAYIAYQTHISYSPDITIHILDTNTNYTPDTKLMHDRKKGN